MTSLYEMPFGKIQDFIRRLVKAGLDEETVQQLLKDDSLAGPWVAQLMATLHPPLFVSNGQQLKNAREWFGDYFHKGQFANAEMQMANLKAPTEPLHAWVLTPHFNTIEQTFDWLWSTIKRVHSNDHPWRSDFLKSDPGHLKLVACSVFEPNSLRWVLVDFGAYLGERPDRVRGRDSAHAELLAAACHHPVWARSARKVVNGVFVPQVNLCGYQLSTVSGWVCVPYLSGGKEHMRLDYLLENNANSTFANPVRLEVVR